MSVKNQKLYINNKKIIDFYSKNPQLDFEVMSLIFVDFLEKIMLDINGTINNVITSNILSNVKELSKDILFLKTHQTNPTFQFNKDYVNEKLYNLLTKLYPMGEIINCSKHGDIIIKRHQKKTILFENKYYSTNVQKDEVLTFIRNCDEQNCSGILLSQNTEICTKDNFQIDIQNNNVLIYIHNCNYDEYKIQSCVSLIDHLTDILLQVNNNTNIISNELLLNINQDFQHFINQKDALIILVKETNKEIFNQINNIELPCLYNFLSTKH